MVPVLCRNPKFYRLIQSSLKIKPRQTNFRVRSLAIIYPCSPSLWNKILSLDMAFPMDPFVCPPLWTGGPDPSGYYAFPQVQPRMNASSAGMARVGIGSSGINPQKHSQYPITTGEILMALL